MYENLRQENAYQLLVSESLPEFQSDDDMESYVLGLQRRFSLSNTELIEISIQAALTMLNRGKQKAIDSIQEMDESALHKSVLRVGVEAAFLPLQVKAHLKKEGF